MFEKVRDAIVETLGCEVEAVKPEASLVDDLGADSLSLVELILALEDSIGIHVEEDDASKLKTVGDILAYLESREQ